MAKEVPMESEEFAMELEEVAIGTRIVGEVGEV
jgi:hypothetical protein